MLGVAGALHLDRPSLAENGEFMCCGNVVRLCLLGRFPDADRHGAFAPRQVQRRQGCLDCIETALQITVSRLERQSTFQCRGGSIPALLQRRLAGLGAQHGYARLARGRVVRPHRQQLFKLAECGLQTARAHLRHPQLVTKPRAVRAECAVFQQCVGRFHLAGTRQTGDEQVGNCGRDSVLVCLPGCHVNSPWSRGGHCARQASSELGQRPDSIPAPGRGPPP